MHNKPDMDETEIPFKFLSHSTQFQLANKLDPKAPISGNDWRMLAEKLGYNNEHIYVIEEQKSSDGRNTIKLFSDYVKRQSSSVNKVIKALKEMDRGDALGVLLDAMPDIEKSYREEVERRQPQTQPMEHEMSHWSQGNPSHHAPGTGCYTPNIGFPCIHTGQPPLGGQPCLSCTSAAYNNYHPCFTSVNHSMYRPHTFEMNGHIKGQHDREIACASHPSFSCHGNGFLNSHVGGMGVHGVYRNNHKLLIQNDRSLTSEQENNSMVAEPDLNQEDFSLGNNDVEMEDQMPMEDQVPLPNAIFRAQKQVMNIPSLISPDIDISHEEEVSTSTSEDFSSGDSDLGPLGEGVKYYRQMSEECNANQPVKDRPPRKGYPSKKPINIPKSVSDYGIPSDALPLENLERLATLPKKYMPNQAYKTFVAEQKVDDSQQKLKLREERGSLAQGNSARSVKDPNENVDQKKVNTKLKNGLIETPKTFPMRMKPHNTGVMIAHLREQHEKTTIMTKSVSLPNDMKPEVFRKAFRHIKVFVTYSHDNKKHIQRVLSLCNCLLKNGFSCCVDVQGRKMENCVQTIADVEWYKQKFIEADFVLVCVSNKYNADLKNNGNESSSHSKLHTKYIYDLMLKEYNSNNCHNLRFVPVLMDGMTRDLIPSWMQQTPIYHWPAQYKDLLWMLTKPEERIKPKPKSYTQHSNMAVSPEMRRP